LYTPSNTYNVQQNYNPSRDQKETGDVKRRKRGTHRFTLLQGVSKQALSFAGKEGTLIAMHPTNNLLHK
jgi:hypothetical protein